MRDCGRWVAIATAMTLFASSASAIDVVVSVYLDPNSDGDLSDAIPAEGVSVFGYLDLFDGLPSGLDDLALITLTTGPGGTATFSQQDGTWWIAVDSQTVVSAPVWAVQTYGSRGAFCADGSGGTFQRGTAGPCFGGRRDGQSDLNLFDVGVAEHVAEASGSGVVELDFGFGLHVVTTPRDGDDDVSTDRTVQGSLRQALTNATVIGSSPIRFVPAGPTIASTAGQPYWLVEPVSALPPIAAPFDGRPRCHGVTCALGEFQSRPLVGMSQSVGVGLDGIAASGDEAQLGPFPGPLLAIRQADPLVIQTPNATLRAVALIGNGVQIAADNVVVDEVFVGIDVVGEPISPRLVTTGVSVASGSTGIRVQNTRIVVDGPAIEREGAGQLTVLNTEILTPSQSGTAAPAIDLIGSGEGDVIDRCLIDDRLGAAVVVRSDSSGFDIHDSTIVSAAQSTDSPTGAIVLAAATVSPARVAQMRLERNGGPALVIESLGLGTRYERSSCQFNSGICIDAVADVLQSPAGDGVTANTGSTGPFDAPVLDYAFVVDDEAALAFGGHIGLVGQPWTPSAEVEIYVSDDDGDNLGEIELGDGQAVPHGEPVAFIGACPTASDGAFDCVVPISGALSGVLEVSVGLTAVAHSVDGTTSEVGPNTLITSAPPVDGGVVFGDAGDVADSGLDADGGTNSDAGHRDGGDTADAGAFDAASPTPDDAGQIADGGDGDGGMAEVDAGSTPVDAGQVDAGQVQPVDAGQVQPVDAGQVQPVDAGQGQPVDAGQPDAGAVTGSDAGNIGGGDGETSCTCRNTSASSGPCLAVVCPVCDRAAAAAIRIATKRQRSRCNERACAFAAAERTPVSVGAFNRRSGDDMEQSTTRGSVLTSTEIGFIESKSVHQRMQDATVIPKVVSAMTGVPWCGDDWRTRPPTAGTCSSASLGCSQIWRRRHGVHEGMTLDDRGRRAT